MATKVEAARALIYEAATTYDRGEDVTKIAAIAKYYASEIGVQVADKALQIYSGYGYMRDYPLERMYRDARIVPIYEGTSEVQKMISQRDVKKLESASCSLQSSGNSGDKQFVNAFVTASLIVCIGAMAIAGAIQDGIKNNL